MRVLKTISLLLILNLLLYACQESAGKDEMNSQNDLALKDTSSEAPDTLSKPRQLSVDSIRTDKLLKFETKLKAQGLVGLPEMLNGVLVDLAYSKTNNFVGQRLYPEGFNKCYLQQEVMEMLVMAQKRLHSIRPGFKIVVYDAVRPFSVQQKMWEVVKGTEMERYVAEPNPNAASLHNYGCAVDCGLVNEEGVALDMGTEFDHLGELAQPRYHDKFLAEGKLTQEQVANRKLLKVVMKDAGFQAILSEWWHFNGMSKEKARAKYKLIR